MPTNSTPCVKRILTHNQHRYTRLQGLNSHHNRERTLTYCLLKEKRNLSIRLFLLKFKLHRFLKRKFNHLSSSLPLSLQGILPKQKVMLDRIKKGPLLRKKGSKSKVKGPPSPFYLLLLLLIKSPQPHHMNSFDLSQTLSCSSILFSCRIQRTRNQGKQFIFLKKFRLDTYV